MTMTRDESRVRMFAILASPILAGVDFGRVVYGHMFSISVHSEAVLKIDDGWVIESGTPTPLDKLLAAGLFDIAYTEGESIATWPGDHESWPYIAFDTAASNFTTDLGCTEPGRRHRAYMNVATVGEDTYVGWLRLTVGLAKSRGMGPDHFFMLARMTTPSGVIGPANITAPEA